LPEENAVRFADGKVHVLDFSFDMPLVQFGCNRLAEQMTEKRLTLTNYRKIAQAFGLELHEALEIDFLRISVASVMQHAWYQQMGGATDKVQRNYEAQLQRHAKHVDDLRKGKVKAMPKKAASPKKTKEPDKPLLYKLLSSKIGETLKKKVDNAETGNHDAVIVQVLSGYDTPKDLDTIAEKVKATGRYKTNDKLPASVRWHLNKLEKDGVVAAKEA